MTAKPITKGDNFRLVQAPPGSGKPAPTSLVAFFGQFEPAYPGLGRLVLSLDDHRVIERDAPSIAPVPQGQRGWWDGSPLMGTRDPHDARAHAAEFRERMKRERGQWP